LVIQFKNIPFIILKILIIIVNFSSPPNKTLRSSVRNLNLLKQNLFYGTSKELRILLEVAPELEVLQLQDVSEDMMIEQEHPKLKQLQLLMCNVSPTNIIEKCPNLEIFVCAYHYCIFLCSSL